MEYLELEGTKKDYWVELLALNRSIPQSKTMVQYPSYIVAPNTVP